MSEPEYELKIGILHHPSLKTTQLLEFLTNETNDFLTTELPQNLMVRESFYAYFQPVATETFDRSEFVGFILLYSSSSQETLDYVRQYAPEGDGDDFVLLVEMDNTEKRLNVVGGEGHSWAQKAGMLFVRLTLYNSDDLVANLNRSLYLLIENFYYPNEEDRNNKTTNEIDVQINPSEFVLDYDPSDQKIIATLEERDKLYGMIEKAGKMRTDREMEIQVEQGAIDESIENVEKMLNNINRRIREKMESNWFTSLKDSLYKPIEKESKTYNKIKLTQEFLDEPKVPSNSRRRLKEGIYSSRYNASLQSTLKRLDSSLMKIVVLLDEEEHGRVVEQRVAELEVFENSTYEELALNALRKLGLLASEKNINKMREIVKGKVEAYVKQLGKGVRIFERQRTFERSYLAVDKK